MTGVPVGNIGNEAEYRERAKAFWSDVFGVPTSLIAKKVLDDLGDPEPWVCGDPDLDDFDLHRHPRKHEPYHCGAVWAPRPEGER